MGDTKKKINGVDDSVWDGATRDYQESEKVENYGAQSDAMYDKTVNFKGSGDPQALYEQYKNYGEFSYDPNKDVLFQNAKASAMANGAIAMQDTVGMASAMTGGYGNSYAATAGSQAYQDYLSSLDDDMATYYQLALDQYQQGKDDLLTQYQLASDLDNTAYQRQRDAYGMAYDRYNTERNFEYGDFWNNKNFQEGQRQFDEAQNQQQKQFNESMAWEKEYAAMAGNGSEHFDSEAYNKKVEYYSNLLYDKDGYLKEGDDAEIAKEEIARDIISNHVAGLNDEMVYILVDRYLSWEWFAEHYEDVAEEWGYGSEA